MMISIIIPLYNKQTSILKTINSILLQDYGDYEIVVVDDGSTDDSVSVVENLHSERIKLYQKENGGPSSARNYGVKKAEGDWILFLDADDTLEPGALSMAATNIKKHRFADVFTYNLYVEQNGNKYVRNVEHTKGYCQFPFMNWYLNEIYPRTGTMVMKRYVMLEEPYREDIRRSEDTENVFRIMRKFRFYACKEPLFTYVQDTLAASMVRNDIKEDFCGLLELKGKSIFEQMALYRMYYEACSAYPNIAQTLYGDTFNKRKFIILDKCFVRWRELKGVIRKLIKNVYMFLVMNRKQWLCNKIER